YISSMSAGKVGVWTSAADGSGSSLELTNDFYAFDVTPDGKFLLGSIPFGQEIGIWEYSMERKERTSLIPGVTNLIVRFAPDGKSFVYLKIMDRETIFYRQRWEDGKMVGEPKIAARIPFNINFGYSGNAYDFTSDLSRLIYAKPGGQADLFLLTG